MRLPLYFLTNTQKLYHVITKTYLQQRYLVTHILHVPGGALIQLKAALQELSPFLRLVSSIR